MLVNADTIPAGPAMGKDSLPHVDYECVYLHRGCRLCTARSVDTSRIRDILKEEIGKLPAKVEPVGERCGGQELSG
jgi:hypothetical protein